MKRNPEEQAQTERFDELYVRAQSPVMLSIERSVCGCDYGASSWTTRAEAQQIAALLGLRPSLRLLDAGAGSGWPGLYMAETSGCDVVLVDLPFAGLRIAAERAGKDRIPGTCWVVVADGAILPFPDRSFDAVSHSDLLCCLRQKRAVLEACRGVIRNDGRMAFTVISIAPGLSPEKYRRAVENGPEFIESEADYPTLLGQTGWATVDRQDITRDYAASCRRQLQADKERKDALETLIGASEFAERQAEWRSKLTAIEDGLLRRELFVATPDRA
ncbi:MAG: class I SAM-dependent methyltransferase [Dongiaceae bacterium]